MCGATVLSMFELLYVYSELVNDESRTQVRGREQDSFRNEKFATGDGVFLSACTLGKSTKLRS